MFSTVPASKMYGAKQCHNQKDINAVTEPSIQKQTNNLPRQRLTLFQIKNTRSSHKKALALNKNTTRLLLLF